MRCVWKHKRKWKREEMRWGWDVTPGDRVPFLAWLSSLPGHMNAKGPDSVPVKHSVMFSEWLQEQIGPKSFNSFLKYNRVSTLFSFGNPGHMLEIN